MSKEINVKKDAIFGDSTLVQTLSKKRKLNKGKGYSLTLVNLVKKGKRNNPGVHKLFVEVIENRNQLL